MKLRILLLENFKGVKIIENNIPINYKFYVTNQIMKPIQQVFALVLEDLNGFKENT